MTRVATHLIAGFPGAGKTTLLRTLLSQRPHGEHWALLLNAAGGVDNTDGVSVRQISDGCACCTARVAFRTALVQLLRAARPQRLLIELAGTGDPAGIKTVLNEVSIECAVILHGTLCVVQPRHLANADITGHEIFRSQLRHADYIVLAMDHEDAATRGALATLGVRDTAVVLMKDAGLRLLDPAPTNHSNDNSRQISS
jgi:G3E family GTPase